MKKAGWFMILVSLFVLAPAAHAASVWEMAKSDHYGRKLGGMLGRGLINIATCFVDVIVHTVEGTKEGPPFVGTMTGLGSGIGCTALRVTSGALDIVTSWVPGFNGFPVSRSYYNCLEVEGSPQSAAPTYTASPQAGAPQGTYAAPPDYGSPVVAAEKPKRHDPTEYVKK